MNRKNYYITIIVVLIIYLIISIILSAYYVYSNAYRAERIVDEAEVNITRISKVLCEPITENATIKQFFTFNVSTPEGINFCSQLE